MTQETTETPPVQGYLLDTSVCIALLRPKDPRVRDRFEMLIDGGVAVAVSTVVVFELWFGVEKSARVEGNERELERFLDSPIDVLPLDADDAREAGRIRVRLQRAGTPIGPYDVLIAGQSINRGLTLVTANRSEFSRVTGLKWEDWSEAS